MCKRNNVWPLGVPEPEWAWFWKFCQIWNHPRITLNRQGLSSLTFKKIYQKMAWASNLQKKKQNRKDSMCWEKKINFVFLLARWWKKLARVFLCILRKHVLIFSFKERSEIFCVFSSLLSLFWDRVEFFFVSIEQQKRDFTSEIWASRIMMKTTKN